LTPEVSGRTPVSDPARVGRREVRLGGGALVPVR
jgi:hypothetical protein